MYAKMLSLSTFFQSELILCLYLAVNQINLTKLSELYILSRKLYFIDTCGLNFT